MKCKKCGNKLKEDDLYCDECGFLTQYNEYTVANFFFIIIFGVSAILFLLSPIKEGGYNFLKALSLTIMLFAAYGRGYAQKALGKQP